LDALPVRPSRSTFEAALAALTPVFRPLAISASFLARPRWGNRCRAA
jgi:hypothetical protein